MRCSAGGRVVGRCRSSSFTDGCLIVGREAPTVSSAGGAAADFAANFECMPPPDAGGASAPVLDKTTRDLLKRLGAGSGGSGSTDRCFNLGATGGGSGSTLCAQGIGSGGKAECTNARALCFRSSCDSSGKLTVEIAGIGSSAPARLECPTGDLIGVWRCLVAEQVLAAWASSGFTKRPCQGSPAPCIPPTVSGLHCGPLTPAPLRRQNGS